MKRTLLSLLYSSALAAAMFAAFAWGEPVTVQAQETEQPIVLGIDVTIETADGDVITLPLQIDDETLLSLTALPPSLAVMDVMNQLVGRELLTITIAAPTVFTPVASALVIEPLELPVPPLGSSPALTGTGTVSEVAAAEAATETVSVEVPPVVEEEPAVVTAAANLRDGPTIEANVIGQISADTVVTLTGRNSDGSWFQIDDGSWVVGFVVQNAPATLPIVMQDGTMARNTIPATVTGTAVVLRSGPSQNDESLGAYEDGTVAAVVSRSPDGGWLEVLAPDGKLGWMSADFLDVADALEGLPTVISTVGSTLTGQVVDNAGEGIGDIVVSATPTGQAAPRVDATTASNGAFTLYMTPGEAREWTVRIVSVGCDSRIVNDRCQLFGYFASVPEVQVTLPSEQPITLVYEEATSFIAGTVVDAEGEPMGENIRVTAEREDGARTAGLTSSTGKFVLPAASGMWTVATDDGPSIEVEVPEKSAPEPVDIPLE